MCPVRGEWQLLRVTGCSFILLFFLFVFGWLVWLCFLFLFLIYDHEHHIPGVEVRGQLLLLQLVFSLNPFGDEYLLLLLRSWAQQLADLHASCRLFLSFHLTVEVLESQTGTTESVFVSSVHKLRPSVLGRKQFYPLSCLSGPRRERFHKLYCTSTCTTIL